MTAQDNDFPAPHPTAPQRPSSASIQYDLSAASAAYIASPEFAETKHGYVVDEAFARMNGLASLNASAVAWACYDWLHVHEAGLPYVPLIDGAAREDARFWAETATPAELECYGLAAIDKLRAHNAPFVSRQIKRLVAALWARMAPGEQKSFVEWIVKDLSK
jgi:hypothetical protein